MKILVTGSSGLVGSAIMSIPELKTKYSLIDLRQKDCDLKDYNQAETFFKDNKPDYVIHLAANVGGLFKNMKYKVEMVEDNLLINMNILKCCHKFNVKKLVCCLSTCVFPDKISYPIDESVLHNGPPHSSNYGYAYAKRMLEIQCKTYNEQFGTNFICVIPTNIYGPNDNFCEKDGHVIPALINKCYNAKKHNQKFVVKGTGKPLRQFIYSEDLAKLIIWVLEAYNDRTPIILSGDEEVSINHIAQLIAKNYNYEDNLYFDDSYSDGQYKKTANNQKLKCLYGNKLKFTNIETGIEKSVKWFTKNYDMARK